MNDCVQPCLAESALNPKRTVGLHPLRSVGGQILLRVRAPGAVGKTFDGLLFLLLARDYEVVVRARAEFLFASAFPFPRVARVADEYVRGHLARMMTRNCLNCE